MTITALRTPARTENILNVLKELERIKKTKRDYLFPAVKLKMTVDGRLNLAGTSTFQVGGRVYTEWPDAEAALDELQRDQPDARIINLNMEGSLPLSRTAFTQLAGKLNVPVKYMDYLTESGHGDLVATNFSTLLARSGETRFLLRTLDGRVRAVLSNSYRVMDNADVFFAAAETLKEAQAELWHMRLWEDGWECFAVSRTIADEVKSCGDYQSQRHGWWTQGGQGNDSTPQNFRAADDPLQGKDMHYAAVRISNSETGRGGLHVEPCVLRAVCNNAVVVGKKVSSIHLGRRRSEEGLVFAADTQESEARTTWLKLRDTIRSVFDPDTFRAYIAKLNRLTEEKIERPEAVVEAVASHFEIPDERRAGILRTLFESRDLSRFGLVQAVTYQAHEADAHGDAAGASTLEVIGGQLLEMPAKRFAELVTV